LSSVIATVDVGSKLMVNMDPVPPSGFVDDRQMASAS